MRLEQYARKPSINWIRVVAKGIVIRFGNPVLVLVG
jgi:hypothetical protein